MIAGEERDLYSTLFVPDEPNGSTVLIIHGYGSDSRNCRQYGKLLTRQGTACLTFDLGGHGKSDGEANELSVSDNLVDTQQAYDYLVAQPAVDRARIGLVGMSYGGYLGALFSATQTLESLLLRAPALYPDYLRDQARTQFSNERALRAEVDSDNPALKAVRSFAGRVVLVSSEFDTVIRPSVTQAYARTIHAGEHHVLQGAQHSLDTNSQSAFQAILSDWAEQL